MNLADCISVLIYIFIHHLGSSTTVDRQTYKHTHSKDN